MIYLADKDPNSKFLPKDSRKRAEVISWLMFQMVTPPFDCIVLQSPVLLKSCFGSIANAQCLVEDMFVGCSVCVFLHFLGDRLLLVMHHFCNNA